MSAISDREKFLNQLEVLFERYGGKMARISKDIQIEILQFLRELEYNENNNLITTQNIFDKIESLTTSIDKAISANNYSSSISTISDKIIDNSESQIRMYKQLGYKVPIKKDYAKWHAEQVAEILSEGRIAERFKDQAVELIQNQVVKGASLQQNKTAVQDVDLEGYATQIVRDSSYAPARANNQLIKLVNKTNGFQWIGGLLLTSRSLCDYIVRVLGGKVSEEVLRELLKMEKYQPGLKPNTTVKNICSECGGFGCNHEVIPIVI